jgi:hypothetical protein
LFLLQYDINSHVPAEKYKKTARALAYNSHKKYLKGRQKYQRCDASIHATVVKYEKITNKDKY